LQSFQFYWIIHYRECGSVCFIQHYLNHTLSDYYLRLGTLNNAIHIICSHQCCFSMKSTLLSLNSFSYIQSKQHTARKIHLCSLYSGLWDGFTAESLCLIVLCGFILSGSTGFDIKLVYCFWIFAIYPSLS
jgi:hypothetical protein